MSSYYCSINNNNQLNNYYLKQFQEHIIPTPHPRWGRLLCSWHEKKENDQILTHAYAARIDKVDGGLYLDDLPRKIFAKTFTQLLVRPIHSLLKTVYHLSMLPILGEICTVLDGLESPSEGLKNSLKSLADIVLTPLYGLALIVTSVAVLCLGTLNSESLYSGTAFIGHIERTANWGDRDTIWTLAKCFQPYSREQLAHYDRQENIQDTVYLDSDSKSNQFTNFARAQILYMRHHFDLFDCREELDQEIVYTSPYLTQMCPSPNIESPS